MKKIESQFLVNSSFDTHDFADKTGKIVYRYVYLHLFSKRSLAQVVQMITSLGNGFSNPIVEIDSINGMIEITEFGSDLSEARAIEGKT